MAKTIKTIKKSKKTIQLYTKITTIKQLIESIKKKKNEYFILLHNSIRSSKYITYIPKTKKFEILNYIDETKQTLSHKQLMTKSITNIGYAMKKNAFWRDNQ